MKSERKNVQGNWKVKEKLREKGKENKMTEKERKGKGIGKEGNYNRLPLFIKIQTKVTHDFLTRLCCLHFKKDPSGFALLLILEAHLLLSFLK